MSNESTFPFGSGRRHALIIGVNQSSSDSKPPALKHAEEDAIDFALALESHCGFTITGQHVGRDATTDTIRKGIVRLAKDYRTDDVLIFYFAGHAIPIEVQRNGSIETEIYLVTSDFLREDVLLDENIHISLSYIRKLLYLRSQAHQVVIILDCCFAGEYGRVAPDTLRDTLNHSFREPSRTTPARIGGLRIALTATGHDALATEVDGKSMTRIMLPILRGEGSEPETIANDQGMILLHDLWEYLNQHHDLMHQKPSLPGDPAGQIFRFAYHENLTKEARQQRFADEQRAGLDGRLDRVETKLDEVSDSLKTARLFEHLQDIHSPFDRSFCRTAHMDDINDETFNQFLHSERLPKQQEFQSSLLREELLNQFGWLRNGYLNYALVLCFTDSPTQWVDGASTRCILWPGLDRRSTPLEDRELTRNLLVQYSDTITFLQQFLRLSRTIQENEENDTWEIPFIVLREAVANALIHRVYLNRPDDVRIEIFIDRIEITSPGHLIEPLQVTDLEYENSGPLRNSTIARIFYIRGYAERLGGGISRIQEELKKAQLKPAHFEEIIEKTFTKFRITVYRPNNADLGHSDPLIDAIAVFESIPLDFVPPLRSDIVVSSRLPFMPNTDFVGRETELKTLAGAIGKTQKAAVMPAVVTGLGGIGKTSLVIEFVYRYGVYFHGGVFWLNCADPDQVASQIAACATGLNIDTMGLALDEQVQRVMVAWQSPMPRLLIFDNCEDRTILNQWKPAMGGCRVVVTSRSDQWSTLTQIRLGLLSPSESRSLLQRLCVRLTDTESDAIAEDLGYLPLALHLAGSYLHSYPHQSVIEYLNDVSIAHRSLKGRGALPSPTQHGLNIEATIMLSFNQLDPFNDVDLLALRMLDGAAWCAHGVSIPRDLILMFVPDETDRDDVVDALRRLHQSGLLDGSDSVMLHRLVAQVIQLRLGLSEMLALVEDRINTEASHINTLGIPSLMLPLEPHLRHATLRAFDRDDERAALLASNLGFFENLRGAYQEAQKLYERALAIHEAVVGRDHLATATSMNNLAGIFENQGRYSEAQKLYERALAIYEAVVGRDHLATATSMNNLAGIFENQGRYSEAQKLYERALTINERMLGREHPAMARSVNNLASVLERQGQYTEAQRLFERALTIHEVVLGPQHPDTATSVNNLALVLYRQGWYTKSQELFERALIMREEVLGADHPDTATSINNLALVLYRQGQYTEAQGLFERALAIHEAVLGGNHPVTAMTVNNLGLVLARQGRYEKARGLYERALAIHEAVLGPQHPDTQKIQESFDALNDAIKAAETSQE
ncbi:tetratricopeptide repeat protein [Herpetosiphon llansteffanensis]|uniref:tetratricopeptide repeat protein n=1 Tax=Herpetosiphon llansteffanensis TaxID=2094568 RepID=UPI000D7BDD9A|nr:tetratricopeptide repeat protein [Herpetosiphon llansteffanensis]